MKSSELSNALYKEFPQENKRILHHYKDSISHELLDLDYNYYIFLSFIVKT